MLLEPDASADVGADGGVDALVREAEKKKQWQGMVRKGD